MAVIKQALKKTFARPYAWGLTLAVGLNILFIYYLILLQTTTWEIFWNSNIALYNWLQVVLSIVNALLIGITISMFFYLLEERKKGTSYSLMETVSSFIFSSAASGCPVCGAFLLPTLGIAASLTALPFGGLEIKALSILLLFYAIYQYSTTIVGQCKTRKLKLISFGQKGLELNISRKTLPQIKPLAILILFLLIVYSLPKWPTQWRIDFRKNSAVKAQAKEAAGGLDSDQLFSQINPQSGYEINASYGDLGPKMISLGVIDLEKFKAVYQRAGQPLTEEQLGILTRGSDKKIRINSQNSYFLLNFFWAVGLANRNKVLIEGPMVKYGKDKLGYFASTGGWSLSKTKPMDYYAKAQLIPLNGQEEELVEKVASNIYRPCCNNSTAFPDCNHGMALLGVLELMAANGAGEDEMYQAAKYFNAFWFPQSYYDIALYFKSKEGKEFKDIDPRVLLSKDYSSVSGWQNSKNWLRQNGVIKQAPKGGTGCGV